MSYKIINVFQVTIFNVYLFKLKIDIQVLNSDYYNYRTFSNIMKLNS